MAELEKLIAYAVRLVEPNSISLGKLIAYAVHLDLPGPPSTGRRRTSSVIY